MPQSHLFPPYYNWIRRDIEVVITRRSWKPFGLTPTWVRIPLPPPKQSILFMRVLLFWKYNKVGFEAVKKQPCELFLNGDRRILQSVTYWLIPNALQNSRRIPLPTPRTKSRESLVVSRLFGFLKRFEFWFYLLTKSNFFYFDEPVPNLRITLKNRAEMESLPSQRGGF